MKIVTKKDSIISTSALKLCELKIFGNNVSGKHVNRKFSAKFENQDSGCMLGVVLCMKKLHFVSQNWRKENTFSRTPDRDFCCLYSCEINSISHTRISSIDKDKIER